MINMNLVGRCGFYCGACHIYRAYKDSEKLQKIIAEKENRKSEEIRCEGCQRVLINGWEKEEWGKSCKRVQCLDMKGFNFCNECNEYLDCEKFHEIADYCLKYGANLKENLNKIQSGKIMEWLKEEDKKWRCRTCGNSIPIITDVTLSCHWCGAALSQ